MDGNDSTANLSGTSIGPRDGSPDTDRKVWRAGSEAVAPDWRSLASHPLADIFPMLDTETLNDLADDMDRHGFDPAYPIVLHEGKVLDGRNRLAAAVAAREVGGSTVQPVFADYAGDDPLMFVIRANLKRRHLTVGQRAMLAADCLPLFEERARQRQVAAGGDRRSQKTEPLEQNSAQAVTATAPQRAPQARAEVAAPLGISGASVSTAKKLKAVAPDLAEQVRNGKPLDKANSELNKRQRPRPNVAAALPVGQFSVIYADPPWLYDHNAVDDWAVENHYPTLSVERLRDLTIGDRKVTDAFAPNCVLFLWATSPKLRDAFGVLDAWGFTYKSSVVWVKNTHGAGMGYWGRVDHELLLIGTKGSVEPPAVENRYSSILEATKGRHSAKPTEMYARIEAMLPGATRLELFARGAARDGWTAWGNDVDA